MVKPEDIEEHERSIEHGTCPVCQKYVSYIDFVEVNQQVQANIGYHIEKQIRYCSWEHFWQHKEKKKQEELQQNMLDRLSDIATEVTETYLAIKHGQITLRSEIIKDLESQAEKLSLLAIEIEILEYRL